MTNAATNIKQWFLGFFRVWQREFYLVSHDIGVMMFFFLLPLLYPICYTLIYNPEIVTDMPVVVVDHSRTAESRRLARMLDATQAAKIYDYAPDLAAARRIVNNHEAFGILEIPESYSRKLGRGEQAVATFYCDMSLLLRYRTFISALADLQLAIGAEIQAAELSQVAMVSSAVPMARINSDARMLGDPTQGFASFVIPGILVLILQQSMVLGVVMLGATSAERRRRNGGIDPLQVQAPAGATLLGKVMCYLALYAPIIIYVLRIVPMIFSLPHVGSEWDYVLFLLPMLVASAFMGQCISWLVTEREETLLAVVFTSVVFLFLSGLTWPRYAMSPIWVLIGDMIPATWGVEGFIRMNSNGSPLYEQAHPYRILWLLAALYFTISYALLRFYRSGWYTRRLNRRNKVSDNA